LIVVIFHTMDLVVDLCTRSNRHVTLEKHYAQEAGNPDTKKLQSIKCRYAARCSNSDCKLGIGSLRFLA